MKYLYLPLYRMAISYLYSFGRRWSVLEHMLLVEVASSRKTMAELAALSNLPDRLVIEALINLLRSNWIEVRSDNTTVYFTATPTGLRRAGERTLPERLQKDIRWDSVCVDRLVGHWMRADELDLVYEKDLPADAVKLTPLLHTFDPNNAALRDLFRLNLNESLEPMPPQLRPPSTPYARIGIAFSEVQTGLSPGAPLSLHRALVDASSRFEAKDEVSLTTRSPSLIEIARDEIGQEDIVVGGTAHLELIRNVLEQARSTVVIHSCFLSAETLEMLLPNLESAAKRKVRVELLWGLHVDPETSGPIRKLSDAKAVLAKISTGARNCVRLSPISSGSHAKAIIYDDLENWNTIVGSCNFLSSDYDWMEVSLRTRSALFASRLMSRLLSNQLPAVGGWPGTARRLNAIWSKLKQHARANPEQGRHKISLLVDHDHYACTAYARDCAKKNIEIACDLYGLAAETSILVPMETAASRGLRVRLQYTRPSKFLLEEGQEPSPPDLAKRGLEIARVEKCHAKYLAWDEDCLAITSFNWMATSLDSKHGRGAELGALVEGPGISAILTTKLKVINSGDTH